MNSLEVVQEQMKGISDYYPETAWTRLREKNEGTTLGPCVWLTNTLIAIEIMKVLLNWGKLALAPSFAVYDPFQHRIPSQR